MLKFKKIILGFSIFGVVGSSVGLGCAFIFRQPKNVEKIIDKNKFNDSEEENQSEFYSWPLNIQKDNLFFYGGKYFTSREKLFENFEYSETMIKSLYFGNEKITEEELIKEKNIIINDAKKINYPLIEIDNNVYEYRKYLSIPIDEENEDNNWYPSYWYNNLEFDYYFDEQYVAFMEDKEVYFLGYDAIRKYFKNVLNIELPEVENIYENTKYQIYNFWPDKYTNIVKSYFVDDNENLSTIWYENHMSTSSLSVPLNNPGYFQIGREISDVDEFPDIYNWYGIINNQIFLSDISLFEFLNINVSYDFAIQNKSGIFFNYNELNIKESYNLPLPQKNTTVFLDNQIVSSIVVGN